MKILLVSLFVLLVILAGQQAFASQAGLDPLQAKITQGDSGVSIKAIAFDPGEGEWLELQIYPPSGKTFSADDSNKITILDGSGAKISLLFDNLRGSTVFRAKLSQPFESNYRGSASYPVTVKVSSGALTGEYVISATLVGKYGQGAFFNGGLVVNAAGQNPIPNPQPNTGNSMQEKAGDSNIVTLKVSIQPRKDIKVKETVKISAQVKNLGSKAGTKTIDGKITWYSEGKSKSIQLSSQKVKLGPGEQTFLDWDGIKLTSGGSYDIIIGEGSLQFSVKEIKKTSEKKETEKKESIKRDEKPKEDKKKREPAKETEKKKQSSGTDKKPTKQLLAPGKVHGIVILLEKDGTTAAPLPYITVTLKDSSGTRKELTDHDGRYEFKNVVPGPVSVSISLPQGVEVANDDTHEIVVEPGSTNTSDFGVYYQKSSVSVKMQPAEVHGSVYLAEKDGGKAPPLRNLTVTLQDGSGTRTEQTDANGEYEFKNVVPGPVFVYI